MVISTLASSTGVAGVQPVFTPVPVQTNGLTRPQSRPARLTGNGGMNGNHGSRGLKWAALAAVAGGDVAGAWGAEVEGEGACGGGAVY